MKLNGKESIRQVISSMTLEEKLTLLTGKTFFKTQEMEKYGIPSAYFLDGGTGASYMQMVLDVYFRLYPAQDAEAYSRVSKILAYLLAPSHLDGADEETMNVAEQILKELETYIPGGQLPGCFPPGIALAATWDAENIYKCARAVGRESHFYGIDVLLGTPNVNIQRDPMGGRVFEGYSEDPCLISKLAPAFVKGIEDEGIIANVKHFAANNQETNRRTVNEHISERALREIYLPGFKACVQDGGCKTVMSAYNAINDEFCAHNHWLLTKILRDEWGFDGFVVSDWGGAYDPVKAWSAGNDVIMPGPRPFDSVIKAVQSGELDEEKIDESLSRFLSVLLEMPAFKGRRYTSIDRDYSTKAAYESISEGMVLLKNLGVLPFSHDANLCFWGEHSKRFLESGGGSANVVTAESTSMLDTAALMLGRGHVTFEEIHPATDAVVITASSMGSEGFDRSVMDVDDKAMLLDAIAKAKRAGKKIVVILNVCGPVDVSDWEADADAILCVFFPGMQGGRAAAEVLLGKINPSGKLPITFPMCYRDCPSSDNFPGRGNEVWYGEGIMVGYRYYDYRDIEPRYPFGFGLSYTNFEITSAKLSKDVLDIGWEDDAVTLTVTLKNTGRTAGKEVIQVYVSQKNPTLVKPPKELKAFKKITLLPGEQKCVEFSLTKGELESYDDLLGKWYAEPDNYQILVGDSSRNITHVLELEATGWNINGLGADSSLREIAALPEALDTLIRFVPEGAVTKDEIALTLLFRSANTLSQYWKSKIEPELPGDEEQKAGVYKSLLKEMNRHRMAARSHAAFKNKRGRV
jgi:beta-glucosidase